MQLTESDIHIWTISLTLTPDQESVFWEFLDEAERKRAQAFISPLHRQRFIAAHGALRIILGEYLNHSPADIVYGYHEQKKPYIDVPTTPLQFNLAHSEDLAICGLTLSNELGIDIEKIKKDYKEGVVRRFFSSNEQQYLNNVSKNEQITAFYRIWARKEALVKALGKGLSFPFADFSVAGVDVTETLLLENKKWTITPLWIDPNYQAALAYTHSDKKISFWSFFDHLQKRK